MGFVSSGLIDQTWRLQLIGGAAAFVQCVLTSSPAEGANEQWVLRYLCEHGNSKVIKLEKCSCNKKLRAKK